jgi:uncharacterized protein involved in cysteine biosynthesis
VLGIKQLLPIRTRIGLDASARVLKAPEVTSVVAGLGGFFRGARAVVQGSLRVLSDSELRKLALAPVFLTTIAYLVGGVSLFVFGDDLWARLWARPESGWMLPLWYVALVVAALAVLVVAGLLFATVAEALGGPFYDKLAIKLLSRQQIATKEPGLIAGIVPDLFRSFLFLVPTVVCAVLGLVPGIGLLFGALGFLISSLGLASAAINPALAVTEHGLSQRIGFVMRHPVTMLGLGSVILLSLTIPFLALLTLPGAIVGATDLYAEARAKVESH